MVLPSEAMTYGSPRRCNGSMSRWQRRRCCYGVPRGGGGTSGEGVRGPVDGDGMNCARAGCVERELDRGSAGRHDVIECKVLKPESDTVVRLDSGRARKEVAGGRGGGERGADKRGVVPEVTWAVVPSSRMQSSVAQSIQLNLGESMGWTPSV